MTRTRTSAAALAALLATGCGSPPPPKAVAGDADVSRDTALLGARSVEIAAFRTAPVTRVAWRDATRAPARLVTAPSSIQRLGAIAEGRVVRVHVAPGDPVRRGQVLVRLHSHEMMDARAKLAQARILRQQAEADLRFAASQAERAERLHAARALALAELERARLARADAEARRDVAQAELERATAFVAHLVGDGPLPADYDEHEVLVRSGLDGVVVSRDAQEGAVVTVGAPLVAVARPGDLWLVAHLPETAAAVARVGTRIRFTVPAAGDRAFDAVVQRVAPAVDTLTRTLEVQAVVTSRDPALRPEQFATAELAGPPGPPTWAVPAAALQAIEGDTVVITADRRGEGLKLEAMRVRVGRRSSDWAELLAPADTTRPVVTDGAAIAKAEILKQRGG